MTMLEDEEEVLGMYNGDIPMVTGRNSWFWACTGFLQRNGYLTRGLAVLITEKGIKYLADRKTNEKPV